MNMCFEIKSWFKQTPKTINVSAQDTYIQKKSNYFIVIFIFVNVKTTFKSWGCSVALWGAA